MFPAQPAAPLLPQLRITGDSALNKTFQEWSEVFPGAACVRTIVDRFIHRCEVVSIAGESYRLKESQEATEARAATRAKRRSKRRDDDGKPA